jgi:hypothetical protein
MMKIIDERYLNLLPILNEIQVENFIFSLHIEEFSGKCVKIFNRNRKDNAKIEPHIRLVSNTEIAIIQALRNTGISGLSCEMKWNHNM